jgi:3-hydroxyacyl-[acyl-carrier-protein] dehydratase
MWHLLGTVETSTKGEITCEVQVPLESLWFSGHFPGDPILPGIAQLGIVYDAVCWSRGDRPGVAGFSRVKFKKMIRPRDRLKITIVPKHETEGAYAFRIVTGEEIACSGNLALRKPEDIIRKGSFEHDEE